MNDDELYEQIAKRRYEYDYTSPWEHLAPTPRKLLVQAARNTMEPILARVRRDAAREALAGMASAHTGAFMEEGRPAYRHEHNIAAQAADNYMRAHYPEEAP